MCGQLDYFQMVLSHMSLEDELTKNYRRMHKLDALRNEELEVLRKLLDLQDHEEEWDLEERAVNGWDVAFIEEELDFISLCSPKSEIERILGLLLRQWIREQSYPSEYRLLPQFPILVDNNARLIDFLLVHKSTEGSLAIAIECDGKHHDFPKVKKQDSRKDRTLRKEYKINTLRFAGRHIYQRPAECIFRIESNIKNAKKRDYRDCYFLMQNQ